MGTDRESIRRYELVSWLMVEVGNLEDEGTLSTTSTRIPRNIETLKFETWEPELPKHRQVETLT